MPRKLSEFTEATAITAAEFLIRQGSNKRLPLSVLQAWIASLGGGGGLPAATLEEAQAAVSNTVASTPAKVREYLEQFGLTATYTDALENCNSAVKGGMFSWDADTLNAPGVATYGRGLTIPSGTGFVTQLGITNTEGAVFVRFQTSGTWSAWIQVAPSEGGGGGSAGLPALMQADLGVTLLPLVSAFHWDILTPKVYDVRAKLFYRTTATSKGIRVGFGGTAGIQSASFRFSAFDSSGNLVSKFTKTKDEALIFPTSIVGGDDNLMEISGQVMCVANGTIQIKIGAAVEFDYCAAQIGSGGFMTPIGDIEV